MKLKREYEMTFKEGLRLGIRLTQEKAYIQNARDAKRLGDDTMAELYMGFAKDWNDLARNAGTSVNQLERFYLKRIKVNKKQRENLNRFDSTE